ncbi:transmembrane protein 8B-like isoform X1 [Argiope bruennichi]|uniref:transmembrane protein 8B-like isoform X1 n=1 Tax=Argiope bruennichi TaxID=94029 RepID=UPI00249458E5|nr:transmembrane protein 8B-like isoform X1 [Argiope bruennichi]
MIITEIWILFLLLFLQREVNSDSLQTQILEARQLFPFRSYKDVQLFHYTIPVQVTFASFQYKANGSFHCPSKTVAVYLQYGSYPVMSLQNSTYPDFFAVHRLFLHDITLKSDFVPVMINITNPLPGNWYAAAFLIENTDRIAQKGLFTPCLSWLSSSLKFNAAEDVISLLQDTEITQTISSVQMYRFFALKNSWSSVIFLTNCSSQGPCPVTIRARQLGLPSANDTNTLQVDCGASDDCSLKITPAANNWNYFTVESSLPGILHFNLNIQTENCKDLFPVPDVQEQPSDIAENDTSFNNNSNKVFHNTLCWPNIPLIRISLPTNLAFEYNLPPEEEDAYPFILNISNTKYTLTSFDVLSTVDIGGTLVIELAVSPFMNLSQNNVSVSGCLSYGIRPDSEDIDCSDGRFLAANTTSWENRLSTLFVPYPEAGIWYFRLKARCYASNFTNSSIHFIPCELPETPVFLRIRSTPCVSGHCGKYGTCYQYVSGGLIFSTCNCIAGWKGWGCTDNSTARTDSELMLDVLLLTLSNLLFIPAIVLSAYRKYYTEAFVYFATMASSAFYHACDAEVYSFCLIRLNVLQFCDFYLAILSIWVTLIAMSKLPNAVQSFVHMAGAIGVALGVEYDRTGLWVFALPTGIGLVILLTSWVTRCYKKHLCYPSRRTWLVGLLPGTLLASAGLIIYAFFETKDNYSFVHSAWHATIALSVLFLLPKGKSSYKSSPEPTSSCSYIRVGDIGCHDASQPIGTPYAHLLAPTP